MVNKHGLSGHYLWKTYNSIIQRTENPNARSYDRYGARGIRLCEEWRSNFSNFVYWIEENLGERPPGKTLDRIDNDGNYEPGNVRWATRAQQNENRDTSYLGEAFSQKMSEVRTGALQDRPNSTGFKWVRTTTSGKFASCFFYNRRAIVVGSTFATPEEAYQAAVQKRIEMGLPIPEDTTITNK